LSGSISSRQDAEDAARLLEACLRGEPWSPELLRELAKRAADDLGASRALFGDLAEGLSDRFESRLAEVYAELFSEVIAGVLPEFAASELAARYRRVRAPRRFTGEASRVENVFVLSRVTLGADIAVTSLVLDAAKRRFPKAQIWFAAGIKSYELFAGDPRVRYLPVGYGRGGTLRERLEAADRLRAGVARPASLVIDPDSRITQLGLLPVCPEEDYFFFESRSYGQDSEESLTQLTRRWLAETFDVEAAEAYIAPAERVAWEHGLFITVSLGVGENLAKRIGDPFEQELLRALTQTDLVVLVDEGPGGEEAERVRRAVAACEARPGQVRTFRGWFADFASLIAQSRLYVGYDSAGQHAAAACGVSLVCVFAGYPCPRMFTRWRPTGRGPIEVVRVEDPDSPAVLEQTLAAVGRASAGAEKVLHRLKSVPRRPAKP